MSATRFHDWPERLIDYIGARERGAFRWGRYANDCFSFAAGGVAAMTGRDIAADLPDYASADAAHDLLQSIGMVAHIDKHLPRRDSPSFAQRGDLVLVRDEDGDETLLLCEGETLVGPGRKKLERLARARGVIAWAV